MAIDQRNSAAQIEGSRASGSAEPPSLCQYLEWDSVFFGCRIARATPNRLDRNSVHAILSWCESNRIDCLYFLADSDDDLTIRLAEQSFFHCVDARVTLERKLADVPTEVRPGGVADIREYQPGDLVHLRRIARGNYRDTRFYYDGRFPTHLVDALYETWIEKSCTGYADAVFVAQAGGQVAGYLSCHQLDAVHGQIGLAGVDPLRRGTGIGLALVDQSLRWFAKQGLTEVRVVTQGRNIQAQRMYARCGFLMQALQIWYHRWFGALDPQDHFEESDG